LTAETVICLLLARLALVCLSFQRITVLISRQSLRPEVWGRKRRLARITVNRAIFNVWRRFPLRTTCFHRAIAAHFMLRRRGVSTTLYYGATSLPNRGLTGHVWLQDGFAFVVGRRAAKSHHVLARYPDGNSTMQ
jgi:hypothetical protein